MLPGVTAAVGQEDSEGPVRYVLGLTEEDGGVVSARCDAPLLRPDEVEAPGAEPLERIARGDIHAVEVIHHDEGYLDRQHIHAKDVCDHYLIGLIADEDVELAVLCRVAEHPGVVKPTSKRTIHVSGEAEAATVGCRFGLIRLASVSREFRDEGLS